VTTALADGRYDLRAIATDVAGNTLTSTIVASRRVDNTARARPSPIPARRCAAP
jgi:hypothetical protein